MDMQAAMAFVDSAIDEMVADSIERFGYSHTHDSWCRTWRGENWAGACNCSLPTPWECFDRGYKRMKRPKSLDEIMAKMAADGITVSVSTRDINSVSGRIGEAAKDAGNYWCVICGSGAGHDSTGHERESGDGL